MTEYKLTYFTGKGLGEPIRMMLSYLKKNFEDVRIKPEEWPAIKPTMPFGKVPVLEIDGKQLHQSVAITRYLGKEANLAGKDDLEALEIDIIVDTLHDLRSAIQSFFYEENASSKSKKKEVVMKDVVPFVLKRLDDVAKANDGYVANKTLSWGDIYFIGIADYLNYMIGMNMFEKYPNLKKVSENVMAIPEIKAWVEKRPKTDF